MKNYISSFFSITYHDCDKLNYNTSFFYFKLFSSRLSTKFDIVLFHPIKYTKFPQKPTHFVVFFFIFSGRFLIFYNYSSDGIIYIIIHTPKRSRLVVSPSGTNIRHQNKIIPKIVNLFYEGEEFCMDTVIICQFWVKS